MHVYPDCTGVWQRESLWPSSSYSEGTKVLQCTECGRVAHQLSEARAEHENEMGELLRTLEGDGRKLIPGPFITSPPKLVNRIEGLLGEDRRAA